MTRKILSAVRNWHAPDKVKGLRQFVDIIGYYRRFVKEPLVALTRTEACPLPDKTALSVADAFFQYVVCRFGMPSVIHSDQGREFENKVMQELCLLCGSHKTRTTPYHPESDGLVKLLIKLY